MLELLSEWPAPVHALRDQIETEPSNLSQQLAVLRSSGLVTQRRDSGEAVYSLAVPEVRDLLAAARHILSDRTGSPETLVDELSRTPGTPR